MRETKPSGNAPVEKVRRQTSFAGTATNQYSFEGAHAEKFPAHCRTCLPAVNSLSDLQRCGSDLKRPGASKRDVGVRVHLKIPEKKAPKGAFFWCGSLARCV
jgi:hypothetical protein